MSEYKTLMLLRHAHSGAANAPFGPDHDRVLTKRGVRACSAIARWIRDQQLAPDFVHCSTAARAQETWDRVHRQLGADKDVDETRTQDLYLAAPRTILRQLANTPAHVTRAMVVAHNPGIGELAQQLALRSPDADMGDMAMKYPTAALAIYRFSGDWSSLDSAVTVLQHYIVPRSLPTID